MSLLPTVLQSQSSYTVDAVQESNSAYYFALQGEGGGSTSNLVNPVIVVCPSGALVQQNGITVQSDVTNSQIYGYYVNDITSQGSLVQLFGQGDVGNLILGDSGGANQSYFVSGQSGTAIGNRNEVAGINTNLIRWDPNDPDLTLVLRSPTEIDTTDASSGITNGLVIPADTTNAFAYGVVISDVNAAGENMAVLVSEGDSATLQLGNSGAANAYFVASPTGVIIGNTDSAGTATPMISWTPDAPTLTLSLNNPVQIVGSSGAGIPYDTVYNPLPSSTPPIITSPTAPIALASWTNALAPASTTPYTIPATGLYLVTSTVTISTGVGYSFPAGSILNLTPRVSGTDDPYNSMTYFLSSTGPQGNITSTQSGLGFYITGSIITGQLNQASSGTINLGPAGGATLYIQQVINQNA